ncbi:unnamed protein product [Heligmosomoides polygyrus]|uniref:DNA repair protein RecO n=1 Tax=Heligmosomoides polygyrus TaxID=6339 RepID=A0A3P7UC53_HELPZ|nr:unnamed protein product [Heligmosomoides polygyrus]
MEKPESSILIGCEVLAACQRDAACIEAVVYRFNLEYCFPGYYITESKRAGGGKTRMRNILLNSYLNRV